MPENGLYELMKQRYEAQLHLEALQYNQRLNSLKGITKQLQNIHVTHADSVSQINQIADDLNKKSVQIVDKLTGKSSIAIDRESGAHLKTLFDKSFELFNTIFEEDSRLQEISDSATDCFLTTANKQLRMHQEFNAAADDLTSIFEQKKGTEQRKNLEENKTSSTHSDDTITTIVSENVFASSPI